MESLGYELQLLPPRCFTDSTVALYWIKGANKTWKPFIQNRVEEIHRLMSAESWNHCPGKDNPADLPKRGLPPLELLANTLWREGPTWLRGGDPCSDVELQPTTDCLAEMRVKDRLVAHG